MHIHEASIFAQFVEFRWISRGWMGRINPMQKWMGSRNGRVNIVNQSFVLRCLSEDA